jgi:hypothetical protein
MYEIEFCAFILGHERANPWKKTTREMKRSPRAILPSLEKYICECIETEPCENELNVQPIVHIRIFPQIGVIYWEKHDRLSPSRCKWVQRKGQVQIVNEIKQMGQYLRKIIQSIAWNQGNTKTRQWKLGFSMGFRFEIILAHRSSTYIMITKHLKQSPNDNRN